VVVRDKSGHPVADLTAKDFELFDKGREEEIESFSVDVEAPVGTRAAATGAAPRTEFNNLHADRGGVTVILIDRLNTAWEDQAQAKEQIVKFLEQIQPDDRVGLYLLDSNRVRVLHDFTTDVASLLRSLARHRSIASGELAASEQRPYETGDAEMDLFLAETARIVNAEYLRRRAENTSEALMAIANHLAGVRGRKNLVWVSSAFPLTFDDPIGRGALPGLSVGNAMSDLQRATRALSDADIAVYPVDARGLVGAFAVNPASIPSTPNSGRTMLGAFSNLESTQAPLETAKTVAENTGGRAFQSTNDISGAIRRAFDDGRVTYLLGYSPSHGEWNGRFREIKVKVRRPGLEVRHRAGYFASPTPTRDKAATSELLAETLRNPLEASGIAVGVRLESVAGSDEVNLAIRLDPRPLTLDHRGENWHGKVALVIAQSIASGHVFKDFDSDIELSLTPEMKERLLGQGIVLNKRIKLRDDAQRVHVVVSDPPSGVVGSVIIPAEKVRAAIAR